MPRKNPKDSAVVSALLRQQPWFQLSGWSLQAINGLPQEEVAKILQKSLVFLSFGYPEGFGLPLAEAAACGCYLIGYSGLGGSEIFQLASNHHSGCEIAYGNWLGFLQACSEFSNRLDNSQDELINGLLQNSQTIRSIYSPSENVSLC